MIAPAAERLARVLDALELECGAPAAHGRLLLGHALRWMDSTAWPDVAWTFSELADGVPFELVWRPGRTGMFWTAEPAPPEWPAGRRLARATRLARQCDPSFGTLPDGIRRLMAQGGAPLWLAGRHEAGRNAAKLYRIADWRAVAPDAVLRALRAEDVPVMIGIAGDGGREWNWRRNGRAAGDRYRLARMGLADAAEALDAALRSWTGSAMDDDVDRRLGISISTDPAGRPRALAAFLRVSAAGGAALVRERLLAAGGESNPALAHAWAAGLLRPMLLTLPASAEGQLSPSLGLTLAR